jgi:uncharacterized protein YcnI
MKTRTAARLLAVTAGVSLSTLGLAAPASAHVTVTPEETAAGSFTVVTMSVPHGCEGSPTTKVAIQIPEDILAVTPTRNPYYNLAKKMQKLPEPVTDAHGNEVTERVGSVVYTAKTSLPDGQRDAFELSLQLPEKAGETLAFPAIQTCEKGETAWTEIPTGDQDEEELEHPAPAFEITKAVEEGEVSATSDGAEESTGASGAEADDDSDTSTTLGIIGVVLGALGLVVGGAALVQVRRRA